MSNFDIAFLTMLRPDSHDKELSKYEIQPTEEVSSFIQSALIQGIESYNEEKVYIINKLSIGFFPKFYKKLYIKTSYFEHTQNQTKKDINIGFINLRLVVSLLLFTFAKQHIKKWAKKNSENKKVLLSYSLNNYTLKSLKYAKKLNPDIITAIIIPDLPEYQYTRKYSFFIRAKNCVSISFINRNIQYSSKFIDKYVLFSEHMREKLYCGNNYIVMEGIAIDLFKEIIPYPQIDKDIKTIFYAGGLNNSYGINVLLKAFSMIPNDNYRLILCGKGDSVCDILSSSNTDRRIHFLGNLPRKEVLSRMLSATILVNPRQSKNEFTKFSFPSKTLECLASGRPLIAYRLEGIPNEYFKYMYLLENESVEAFKDAIIQLCEMDENTLKMIGLKGRNFVLSRKNNYYQASHLLKYLERSY